MTIANVERCSIIGRDPIPWRQFNIVSIEWMALSFAIGEVLIRRKRDRCVRGATIIEMEQQVHWHDGEPVIVQCNRIDALPMIALPFNIGCDISGYVIDGPRRAKPLVEKP